MQIAVIYYQTVVQSYRLNKICFKGTQKALCCRVNVRRKIFFFIYTTRLLIIDTMFRFLAQPAHEGHRTGAAIPLLPSPTC